MSEFGLKIINELYKMKQDLYFRAISPDYWMDVRIARGRTDYRIMNNSIQLYRVVEKHAVILIGKNGESPYITMTGTGQYFNGRVFTIPLDITTEEQYFQYSLLEDISRLDLDDIVLIEQMRVSSHEAKIQSEMFGSE